MQLLNVEDAARLLAISPWTVRAYLKMGKLFPVRIGRRTLLEAGDIERFIQESRVPQAPSHTQEESAQRNPSKGGASNGSDVSND
jgi:excisionase family DNA binding protein